MENLNDSAHNEVTAHPATPRREPAAPATLEAFGTRDVLCADQVAAWFGVDRKTVYNAAARGNLPCQRLGKRLLFSRELLSDWLCRQPTETQGRQV